MFRLWLRSMVAMWRGKNQLSGNALVPLLIGPQGCGKSSFCRILLPPELRDYYNESINFKNEADLNLGLSSFALLNLDEFDRVTKRQQVVLKYLVSTAEVKYRPPYGKAYQSRRRYASFVATTNEAHPLVDNSGSRRFVCVNINGTIDFKTPINYQQLYAQLNHDITKGEPYWPTEEEEQQLIEHNRNFLTISSLDEMLAMAFRKPAASEQGQWLNAKAISDQLKRTFGAAYQEDKDSFRKIGATLHSARFNVEARRRTAGMEYYLIAR
jgi:predicted P-loop ATPase